MPTKKGKWSNSKKSQQIRMKNPFGDFDKDGVLNILDCQPLNPTEHGFFGRVKSWVGRQVRKSPTYKAGARARTTSRARTRTTARATVGSSRGTWGSTASRRSSTSAGRSYTSKYTKYVPKIVKRIVGKPVKKISGFGLKTKSKVTLKPKIVSTRFGKPKVVPTHFRPDMVSAQFKKATMIRATPLVAKRVVERVGEGAITTTVRAKKVVKPIQRHIETVGRTGKKIATTPFRTGQKARQGYQGYVRTKAQETETVIPTISKGFYAEDSELNEKDRRRHKLRKYF